MTTNERTSSLVVRTQTEQRNDYPHPRTIDYIGYAGSDGGLTVVAECYTPGMAVLLATAPDLLAACEAVVKLFAPGPQCPPEMVQAFRQICHSEPAYLQIEAAIAKARGAI